jgi:3-hydroxyisobutyrate dehydrogenase-like beta-hydroxyacid dehydrogenase
MRIAFIGFGEVASVFSKRLREHGAEVWAYDVQRKPAREGVRFGSLGEAVASADYVLSTVTTQAANDAARACAAHLRAGQVFVDLNSTAPSVKQELAGIIRRSQADFVEGAILGAVGAAGAATQILTGGPRAAEASETLCRLGLNVRCYSPEIGPASTFKMLRSILSKGLEALLLELLIAGRRAGLAEDLWNDVVDFMTRHPFEEVASNWVQSHAVAHQRRYQEMVQALETMREIAVDPVMTSATAAFFERSGSLGLTEAFPEKPASPHAVIEFLERRLRKPVWGT